MARIRSSTDPTDAQVKEWGRKALELYDWTRWARPEQLAPPGDWAVWLILAGRGWGKTRCGSEWVRQQVETGQASRIALVAETAADARDVLTEGPSGILATASPLFRPRYEPSKRRITWPNGAVAHLFNATEPDQLRGPQFDAAWSDETAKWKYAQDCWDQLQFGLRIGTRPRQVVTTTPRPIPLIREIMKDNGTVITRGRTLDNARNLAPSFLQRIVDRYGGTRLGRQELDAEVLDDVPNALWTRRLLDENRVQVAPEMQRVVVGVDPSGTRGGDEEADDVGIVVAGLGVDGRIYVLDDMSCNLSPSGWGRRVIDAYKRHQADRIVAETNFGGDMVRSVILTHDPRAPFRAVTASRGKIVRAEPIAALYEQGRVKHVGAFPQLEDELCAFTTTGYVDRGSPDRADAMIWAISELAPQRQPAQAMFGSWGSGRLEIFGPGGSYREGPRRRRW